MLLDLRHETCERGFRIGVERVVMEWYSEVSLISVFCLLELFSFHTLLLFAR